MHRRAPPLGGARFGDGQPAARDRRHRRRLRNPRHMEMTRALVLGGAGFVGTAACKELMRRGVETVAAGRKDRPYGTFTSYVAFDRDDEAQLERALESVQPDVVLDLACDEPKQVDAMIRRFKGDRYVFVSSGIVYPDIDGRPAGEDDFVPLDGEPPAEVDYMAG